jgi:hypothetical protein
MTYVQQIIVSATGTHEDVVTAVALASAESYLMYRDDEVVRPAWDEWLSGRFTKTVRESRRSSDTDRALKEERSVAARVGSAVAVALCPSNEMPQWVKRLRVTGLNRPRGRWFFTPKIIPATPTVAINPQISMTTGKTAAQAAHATMKWLIERGPADFTFSDDVHHFWVLQRSKQALKIEDAGLTEVNPGTTTVAVGVL